MTAGTYPLQLLLLTISSWVHRQQQQVIEYLVEENQVLEDQLGGKLPRLTDDQRRGLATEAGNGGGHVPGVCRREACVVDVVHSPTWNCSRLSISTLREGPAEIPWTPTAEPNPGSWIATVC